jgi:hypothetical protein
MRVRGADGTAQIGTLGGSPSAPTFKMICQKRPVNLLFWELLLKPNRVTNKVC